VVYQVGATSQEKEISHETYFSSSASKGATDRVLVVVVVTFHR